MLLLSGKRPFLQKKHIGPMAGTGLLGVTLYFLFENNGIKLLSASEASIIVGTIPILTVIADSFIQKIKISLPLIVGAVLSTIGVVIMVLESLKFTGNIAGYFFMGGAAITWVAYSFTTKKLEKEYSGLETTFWHSVAGALGFIPFLGTEHPLWSDFSLVIGSNILFLAFLGSALGYLFYIESLAVLGTSITNIFINVIPVISVLGAYIFLKEKISTIQYIGGSLAILGVFIVNQFSPKKITNPAPQGENY